MAKGEASYVLPMFQQKSYFDIHKGDTFGHADLFGRRNPTETLIRTKKTKNDLTRTFTCQAKISCELLTIQVVDLEKMRSEFGEIYNSLYASGQ
jgi:CRP-like cAMP-binding protein